MQQSTKIAEFMSFCIESYAQAKCRPGAAVASLFAHIGALDYLRREYDVLHMMGREWLVEDLDEYIKLRGTVA